MIPHPHPLHGVGSRGFPQPRTCLPQYYDLNVIDSRFSLEEGHHVGPNRELVVKWFERRAVFVPVVGEHEEKEADSD